MGYGSPFQSMAQRRLGTRFAPDLDCPVSIPGRSAKTLRPKQKTTPSKPEISGFERVVITNFALSRRPYFESQCGYLTTKSTAFNRAGHKQTGFVKENLRPAALALALRQADIRSFCEAASSSAISFERLSSPSGFSRCGILLFSLSQIEAIRSSALPNSS